tara:strand:+ start:204 stop:767 length:564 start_codon:yes stop_codon:yes gene_type:complete
MKRPNKTLETAFEEVFVIPQIPFEDNRGSFNKLFDISKLELSESDFQVAQINHSVTKRKETVRGMHYQLSPFAETKLVTCLRGKAIDIVVDIREESNTFLFWHAEILDSADPKTIYIPPGFAHGFQTLTKNCEFIYIHNQIYKPTSEGRIHPSDPLIKIEWPLEVKNLSALDSNQPFLDPNWPGIRV